MKIKYDGFEEVQEVVSISYDEENFNFEGKKANILLWAFPEEKVMTLFGNIVPEFFDSYFQGLIIGIMDDKYPIYSISWGADKLLGNGEFKRFLLSLGYTSILSIIGKFEYVDFTDYGTGEYICW